jgi:hypothetical protein
MHKLTGFTIGCFAFVGGHIYGQLAYRDRVLSMFKTLSNENPPDEETVLYINIVESEPARIRYDKDIYPR